MPGLNSCEYCPIIPRLKYRRSLPKGPPAKVSLKYSHTSINIKNWSTNAWTKRNFSKRRTSSFLPCLTARPRRRSTFFFSNGKKVIDLSADYRLADPKVYEEWYGTPHKFISTLGKAVYGLPEIYRQKIRTARLIANPGCYPTGALLGLLPAIKNKLIDVSSVIIDSKSGASGAGRKADVAVSFCEVNEGFRAYGIGTHRHTPEIEQEITSLFGDKTVVNFTPHLLPVNRGILTTIYAKMRQTERTGTVLDLARETYEGEPFIRLLDEGGLPDIKNVRGTNFCEIGIKANTRTDTLIIVTAIDNLVKGAAGQAVHNMNIMMGFDELTALGNTALFP